MLLVDAPLFYIAADELLDFRKVPAGDVVLKASKQLSQICFRDGCFFFYIPSLKQIRSQFGLLLFQCET
jgi:hypothetical protein